MRIAIDARAVSHPQPGGFKTYTENLIHHLAAVDRENGYVLYLDRKMPREALQQRPNFTTKVVPVTPPVLGVAIREQAVLPVHLRRDGVNLAHFPCATAAVFCPCPFVVTIYDVIGLTDYPRPQNLWTWEAPKRLAMYLYTCYFQRQAVKRAAAIITISQNSKRDIIAHFGVQEDRIAVTYLASSDLFQQMEGETAREMLRQKYVLSSRFILAIASASPRKNVKGLVEAYARLGSDLIEQYQLVIVWTHGLLKREIAKLVRQHGLEQWVIFLENVPDEDLMLLYNAATLFVFPSLCEGFGLPPLEAMSCGTPVVASNTSSLPEVLGDAALLVDPRDANALVAAIRQVLTRPGLRKSLSHRGLERARAFSWEKAAQETVAVYRKVAQMAEAERQCVF